MIEISLHTGRANSLGHPGPEARYKGYERRVIDDDGSPYTIEFNRCVGGEYVVTHAVARFGDGREMLITLNQGIWIGTGITPGINVKKLGYKRKRPPFLILDEACEVCGRSCEC